VPPVVSPGVPANVAVPSLLAVNVTPEGNVAPPSDSDETGRPVEVTVKVPAVPATKVVFGVLVMAGA